MRSGRPQRDKPADDAEQSDSEDEEWRPGLLRKPASRSFRSQIRRASSHGAPSGSSESSAVGQDRSGAALLPETQAESPASGLCSKQGVKNVTSPSNDDDKGFHVSAVEKQGGPSKRSFRSSKQANTGPQDTWSMRCTEEEDPRYEDELYCDECQSFFIDECQVHGPPSFILDTPAPMGTPDRAWLTLPPGLEVRVSSIPGAGLGVFNQKQTVSKGVLYGPYEGDLTDKDGAVDSGYSWMIYRSECCVEYIDARRKTHSNWMRYVNCARNEEEQNLVAFQYRGTILYRCFKPILPGQELLMGSGEVYARFLDITFSYLWNNKCSSKGLQASPPKHGGYAVWMENAVPIVTQAPGAQPLQIQPGLLAQKAQFHSSVPHATVIPDTMASAQPLANWRNSHPHGNHYNPIMQQPTLLAAHVTLLSAQPLNVGVAHVMRQQPTSSNSSKKSRQQQQQLSSRNGSGFEVSSSPQRSKRVKENTPPRCAVVPSNPPSACGAPLSCRIWGDPQPNPPQRQTIVIHDTPSPAISIITISSDTDDEDDNSKCTNTSTMSKRRNDVISCVTVHDSLASDSSNHSSPYAVESRPHKNNGFLSKGVLLDNYCHSNPRTIIIPPPKAQANEGPTDCNHLLPDRSNHQNSIYKYKTSNGALSGSNYSSGGGAQQQNMAAERSGGNRRQQAYVAPTMTAQAPYPFHHHSPSHPHLAAAHLQGQPHPHLYAYTTPSALGSTGGVAHLVTSQGSARHGAYPTGLVHQVPVSVGHHVLPSPALHHHTQYQAQFTHQTYFSSFPGSAVYTGYPLSPNKVSQYPYL